MRNLLLISYYFPPRGGSGVQRPSKFARYLADHGYQSHVVTCDDGSITNTRDNSLLKNLNGTQVHRVPGREELVKKLGKMHLGPLVTLGLRPDAQVLWKDAAVKEALRIAKQSRIDAIFSTVQPFASALVGLELKKKLGLPWILDYRDPWTNSTSITWPSKWHFEREREMERKCLLHCDRALVVTSGMRDALAEAFPEFAHKIRLIPNGFDPEDFKGLEADKRVDDGVFRLGYAGRLYSVGGKQNRLHRSGGLTYRNCEVDFVTHSARFLILGIQRLFEQHPELRGKLSVDLAGNIPADNKAFAEECGVADTVHVHGMLPHREAIQLVSRSDAVFLPMRREADNRRSYNASGKIYEYLAQHKPILAAVPEGDAADLVRDARAGWVVDPADVQAYADKLYELITRKQTGPLRIDPDVALINTYTRQNQAAMLANELDSLLPAAPAARSMPTPAPVAVS
ncbi:MAG: glycosyltransferase family 4 protein [Verrucomicrobiota bacterium JB022]|nr:glycosyltransferase family 4 protein [Verrucomicrobiota bacterium JB022]